MVVIPVLLYFAVFVYYPFLKNIIWMFQDYDYLSPPQFSGLKNLRHLFQDEHFFLALRNTLIITIVSTPIVIAISTLLATILFNMKMGSTIIRSAVFSTYLVPTVVAAIIFKLWFGVESGFVNSIIRFLGFERIPWLTDPFWAMACVVFLSVWKYIGYHTIILLGGLSNIDRQIYEAAKVDGAGKIKIFFSMTIPQLKPSLLYCLIFATITYMRTYAETLVLTNGGPYRSTTTIIMYMFDTAFNSLKVGYAATIAITLFAITLVISLIQMKVTKINE